MKTRIIVLICTALMMAACCGNNQSSSCCKSGEQSCSKEASACTANVKKIISAQVFIKADKVDAFIAATKDLIEKSRAEEGCISYSLYQDPQDKTKFLFCRLVY